ncbi:MAG: TIGR02391 family protein [Thermoproteota archaeon]|nr:TIGR02391 family protein [Thermoproteota archaeon]
MEKIKEVKKKTGNSISKEVAIDIVASAEGIDVHPILKDEEREEELKEFREIISKFDFGSKVASRKSVVANFNSEKVERSPYDTPLAKFKIDSELVSDCKIHKPYRKAIGESLLILETRIRSTLNLPESYTGASLVAEAKKKGVFKRTVVAEENGLYFLFMGAFLWLRNPTGHKKVQYTKEEAIKVVLFTDHLIKLFDDLFNKRI